MSLEGIESVRISNGTDYRGSGKAIRWTEVFFLQTDGETVDMSRLADMLASAACFALTPHLSTLKAAMLTHIGLRATVHSESVGILCSLRGIQVACSL